MNIAILIFTVLIGMAVGSFINVLIYRVPKELSIIKPSSYCPQCNHSLSWYDNIPLISYIILRGKCRYCSGRIPIMYPMTEFLTGTLFAALYIKFGLTVLFIKYAVFVLIVLAVSLTDIYTSMDDFETGMIPEIYLISGISAGIIFSIIEKGLGYYLAGISAGYLVLFIPAYIYAKLKHREGMGEGDFIFFGMIGAFTGLGSIPAILTLSSFFGIISGLVIIFLTKNKEYPIPFAPMLGAAGIIYVFFEDTLNIYNWGSIF